MVPHATDQPLPHHRLLGGFLARLFDWLCTGQVCAAQPQRTPDSFCEYSYTPPPPFGATFQGACVSNPTSISFDYWASESQSQSGLNQLGHRVLGSSVKNYFVAFLVRCEDGFLGSSGLTFSP